ncbi:hypothetical protein CspeluHIS016_0903220 [Cutaneotrichosporon spelunceum]|uniref:N-acetyltransferase domain-containing protein n=1 Tax=Cutaneotrichosporon spelunceum TaxID=1672016 RepID=A0AAD3U074_9TREE|nr:hypothetical protein CspeluHIS016_0903220 [Cutaneotrichosporon spelunceum]
MDQTALAGLPVDAHPPIEELIAGQASMPKWTMPANYVPRGLPPTPELQWGGDEPYLPLPGGYRITPYRACEADYAAVERISNDPAIAQWSHLRPYPYTRADTLKWFDLNIPLQTASTEALRTDPAAKVTDAPVMAIRDPGGALVGDVAVEPSPGFLGVGYTLDAAHQGRGVGRAAAGALVAWAAGRMGREFRGSAQVVNAPSNRVLAGLGFEHTGTEEMPWPAQNGGSSREVHSWRLVV